MSIRSDAGKPESDVTGLLTEMPASTDAALGEGSSYCVASPDNPLHRNLVVSIRASLNDLCLSKSKGTWMPSSEALKSMLQQRKFTSLGGESDHQGDLKSVVLHSLKVDHVSSTFPISLGARVSGVDDNTFTSTGEAFSMVVLPHSNSPVERTLQKDDVSLAYEFAKKFPGYTSGNLSDKGVHEVSARRFVLVAADHPLVSAISENDDARRVKISTGLYDSILPLVRTQVESQIKVRDFSRATVSIRPAEFGSWADARDDLITEEKRPLRAQMEAEISDAAGDDAKITKIRNNFASQERMLESEIDHKPLEMHLSLGISYNFLSK